MTLEELKTRCNEQNIQYAYGLFKTPVEPPFLVAVTRDSDNFMADNKVYEKQVPIQLSYIFIDKDLSIENKIEENILGDIPWNKTEEAYISDEKVWEVSYFFELNK